MFTSNSQTEVDFSSYELLSVSMIGNRFEGLNFLKNPLTDSDPNRTEGYQAMNPALYNRNIGLVVDLSDWSSPGLVNISSNSFRGIQQFY